MTEGLWRAFQPFPETPNVPVSAILHRAEPDGSTSLWLGTDGYGVAVWRGGVWTRIDSRSGALGNDTVLALAESRAIGGRRLIWVGSRNGGLSSFDGERWRRFDQAGGALPSDLVQALVETVDADGRGTLWVGTRDGLAAFDGERWRRVGEEAGLGGGSILALLGSRNRAGIERALGGHRRKASSALAGGIWRHWDESSGLRNRSVQSLHESAGKDGRRTLWIGTDGGGVAAPRDGRSRTRPETALRARFAGAAQRHGLFDSGGPQPPDLPVDQSRRLAAHPDGDRLFQGGVHDRARTAAQSGQSAVPAGWTSVGRLWVGTIGGAAAFDPAEEFRDHRPKRLRLSAQPVGCPECALFDRGVLAHDQNRVQFQYVLLSFFGEPLTRYRTQLAGYDENSVGVDRRGESRGRCARPRKATSSASGVRMPRATSPVRRSSPS